MIAKIAASCQMEPQQQQHRTASAAVPLCNLQPRLKSTMTDPKRDSDVKWPPFNPFVRRPTSFLGKAKMVVAGSILLPIRVVGAISTLLLALIWANLASLGCDTSVPYSPIRRRILVGGIRVFARILLFFYGYVWIQESYEIADAEKRKKQPQPSLVVCNHVGFAELLYLASRDGCCFVSKEANRALPFIGKIAEILQSIFVSRGGGRGSTHSTESSASGGGSSTTDQILERARAPPGTWPPLALCPEGTTTNGHVMIHMHTGAFRSGLPVQPVVASMPFSPVHGYDQSFSCTNIVLHILGLMTQPMNRLNVTHLAVYVPNEKEKADPKLFANNVRDRMAQTLGVNSYELTWADKLRFETSEKQQEMGRRLLAERHGGVAPPMPVFTQDLFGNPLESAKDK